MPTQQRKQREREQRREQILSATQRLIAAESYDNVTMQDIADAVEVSKGSLYLLFQDKDDIVAALVNRSLDALDLIIAEELRPEGSAPERLARLARAYWRFYIEKPELFPNLSLISGLMARRDSFAPSMVIATRLNKLESILRRVIEEGIEEGTIRGGLDVPLLVGLMTVLVNSFLEKLAKLPRTPGPVLGYGAEDLIQEFFDILLFYIKGA